MCLIMESCKNTILSELFMTIYFTAAIYISSTQTSKGDKQYDNVLNSACQESVHNCKTKLLEFPAPIIYNYLITKGGSADEFRKQPF